MSKALEPDIRTGELTHKKTGDTGSQLPVSPVSTPLRMGLSYPPPTPEISLNH